MKKSNKMLERYSVAVHLLYNVSINIAKSNSNNKWSNSWHRISERILFCTIKTRSCYISKPITFQMVYHQVSGAQTDIKSNKNRASLSWFDRGRADKNGLALPPLETFTLKSLARVTHTVSTCQQLMVELFWFWPKKKLIEKADFCIHGYVSKRAGKKMLACAVHMFSKLLKTILPFNLWLAGPPDLNTSLAMHTPTSLF